MKKFLAILLVMVFCFSIPFLSYAGQGDRKQYRRDNNGRYQRHYRNDHPIHYRRHMPYRSKRYPKYNGYRYDGHYSWHEWRNRRHHSRYRHGTYHHDDNGYLMYSFCNNGACFTISID